MSKKKMYEEINVNIRPLEERITVSEKVDGVVQVKHVSLDALVECFQVSIQREERFTTGLLPEGCLAFEVANDARILTILQPSMRLDYTYFKTVYERFPLPQMVFSFDVSAKGSVGQCRVAIIADEKQRSETSLYHFPFSNVYANGEICIGAANSLPKYKNIRALGGLPQHILRLPNNDHNFSSGRNKLKLGYRELLDHLQDKTPEYYYEHVLIPWEGKTLQDFIDGRMGGKFGG